MANRTKAHEKPTWEQQFQEWFARHLEHAQASVDECDREIERKCAGLDDEISEAFLLNHGIGHAPHMVKMETLQLGAIVVIRYQRNEYLSQIKRAQEGDREALFSLYDTFRRINAERDNELLCRMCNAIGASHQGHRCPTPQTQNGLATT